MEFPAEGMPARHVQRVIEEYNLLDFKPQLNTSSYVNVVFEPEEVEVAGRGMAINIADQTIYPGSFKLHNDCLNMVAELWHCPKPASFDEYGCYPGAGTVGSTEACLLAGLALKFRWRAWYAARHGLSAVEARREIPSMVISTCFQAAWEKLFRYMDIEPVFVSPSVGTFTVAAADVAAAVDERTCGVVCIMGNHYGGQYDDVGAIAAALRAVNGKKGYQVGIHVDGASGAFVAPFQSEVAPWDFRVPEVLSVSGSGHKFGESVVGTGWVVWRDRKDLSEHVAVNVSYLGGKGESYTLNFSRPATGPYVQLYKLLRLGRDGYASKVANQMATAKFIRDGLRKMVGPDGKTARFAILDAGDSGCLPVVAASLNPALRLAYDDIDLQKVISERHWYVSGYKMGFDHPLTEERKPLFTDAPVDRAMFRVVVKSNLTLALASDLLVVIDNAVKFLDSHSMGYAQMHGTGLEGLKRRATQHHIC